MKRELSVAASIAALAFVASAQVAPENRVQLSEVALEGPLRRVEIAFADGSGATLELELQAGERRTLRLALPVPADGAGLDPRIEAEGGGSARVLPDSSEDPSSAESAWSRLPMGLRQRPLPPAPASGDSSAPPLAAWLLACAGFALALRWRERGALALLSGALGGAAAFTVAELQSEERQVLVVIEGVADSPVWLSVRVGAGQLEVPASLWPDWVETRPARAPLRLRTREAPGDVVGALASPRAAIYQLEVLDLGSGLLTREGPNRMAPFARTWVRDPDGTWSRHGAWGAGERLPPAEAGGGEPPSWIQPALPLGAGILIAEQVGDSGLDGEGARQTWVRLVGF